VNSTKRVAGDQRRASVNTSMPLAWGMARSKNTRSGFSRLIAAMAAMPSATTSTRPDASSIARAPDKSTARSSAITARHLPRPPDMARILILALLALMWSRAAAYPLRLSDGEAATFLPGHMDCLPDRGRALTVPDVIGARRDRGRVIGAE
jgi:hypothetical protein